MDLIDLNENHIRKLPNGSLLRFYRCVKEYKVQMIVNPGVSDRRLQKHKRESRKILFTSPNRQLAVDAFNKEFEHALNPFSNVPVLGPAD